MCSRIGCDSPPEWRPVIVVRTQPAARPARCVVSLGLCTECKSKVTVHELLSDRLWQLIHDGLVGSMKAAPKRSLSSLDFCGIRSKESLALEKRRPS